MGSSPASVSIFAAVLGVSITVSAGAIVPLLRSPPLFRLRCCSALRQTDRAFILSVLTATGRVADSDGLGPGQDQPHVSAALGIATISLELTANNATWTRLLLGGVRHLALLLCNFGPPLVCVEQSCVLVLMWFFSVSLVELAEKLVEASLSSKATKTQLAVLNVISALDASRLVDGPLNADDFGIPSELSPMELGFQHPSRTADLRWTFPGAALCLVLAGASSSGYGALRFPLSPTDRSSQVLFPPRTYFP
jgi:hypothetical protein